MESESAFLNTIVTLRTQEQITIFTKLQAVADWEEKEVLAFLESEHKMERTDWANDSLPFDANAALWAAKIIYHAAQLLLIREGTAKDLTKLFPDFDKEIKVATQLSADLTLRFLPPIIIQLKLTDSDDALIPILEKMLATFHYSAIGYNLELILEDWATVLTDPTFKKLYLERIVAKEDYYLAEIPYINQQLNASFGLYKNQIWSTLKTINQNQ